MVLVEKQPTAVQKQPTRLLRLFVSAAALQPKAPEVFQSETEVHLDSLYRQALRLTRSSQTGSFQEAEDLVLKTYLRAYHLYQGTSLQQLVGIKRTLSRKVWLHCLMQQVFQHELGHSQPARSVASQAARQPLALQHLTAEAIEEAVAALPTPMGSVAALTLLEGLSCRDAAAVVGISEARSKQLFAEGRLRLLFLLRITDGSLLGEVER